MYAFFSEAEYAELIQKLRFLAAKRSNNYLEQRYMQKQKKYNPRMYFY